MNKNINMNMRLSMYECGYEYEFIETSIFCLDGTKRQVSLQVQSNQISFDLIFPSFILSFFVLIH